MLRKKGELARQADPTTPTLIRCASEATSQYPFAIEYGLFLTSTYLGDAPPDAELKVYANYRPAVIERTQQQL